MEYLQARRDVVHQANARIQQNSGAAASMLLKLMADPTTPVSVRARASQCILEQKPARLAGRWEQNATACEHVFVYRVGPLHSHCLASRTNGYT